MKKITTTVCCILVLTSSSVFAKERVPYSQAGTNSRALMARTAIHWVSIEQIADSLKDKAPMNVSFDIDDTSLFSSPCFYYGQQKYSPGSYGYLKDQQFWDELNAGCDAYSIPKDVTKQLIAMHQERGDHIFFITGRTAGKTDAVTGILKKDFDIKDMSPVNFMGGIPHTTKFNKTPAIIKHHISIHYGDSDDDILAAREAGIRGIRVLRAQNSTYLPLPQAGGYGEEVIINSSY